MLLEKQKGQKLDGKPSALLKGNMEREEMYRKCEQTWNAGKVQKMGRWDG